MIALLFVVCGIIILICEIAIWKMNYDERCEKKELAKKRNAT